MATNNLKHTIKTKIKLFCNSKRKQWATRICNAQNYSVFFSFFFFSIFFFYSLSLVPCCNPDLVFLFVNFVRMKTTNANMSELQFKPKNVCVCQENKRQDKTKKSNALQKLIYENRFIVCGPCTVCSVAAMRCATRKPIPLFSLSCSCVCGYCALYATKASPDTFSTQHTKLVSRLAE